VGRYKPPTTLLAELGLSDPTQNGNETGALGRLLRGSHAPLDLDSASHGIDRALVSS
jgi:hypothetical protein